MNNDFKNYSALNVKGKNFNKVETYNDLVKYTIFIFFKQEGENVSQLLIEAEVGEASQALS